MKKNSTSSFELDETGILTSGTLKKAINSKDELVIKILRQASKDIGVGIANLVNILDPELVVIGGGVIESLSEFMFPLIQNEIIKNTINYAQRNTKIVESQLGDHAVVVGAASYAFHQTVKE
jgi:glucokinase